MSPKRLDDFVAFQLAVDFKRRVYKLIDEHPRAKRDLRYVDQLFAAASGIDSKMAEGWARFVPAEVRQFLRYALGSLEEAKGWLRDGIDRGHFTAAECEELLVIGNRCGAATMAWWKSLGPFVKPKGRAGPKRTLK
jgi:four helix bundle protein